MILGSYRSDLLPIKDRLLYGNDKQNFPSISFDKMRYSILYPKIEDIFFTNPTLFVWVDSCASNIENSTEGQLKYVSHKIFDVPVRDFENLDAKYDNVFSILDLSFNPNLSSKGRFEEVKFDLEQIAQQFKTTLNGNLCNHF